MFQYLPVKKNDEFNDDNAEKIVTCLCYNVANIFCGKYLINVKPDPNFISVFTFSFKT